MTYSRREVVANICATSFLAYVRSAYASKPSLEPDQGIVICRWNSVDSTRAIEFREYHSRPTFSINRDDDPRAMPTPVTAKLGRYYLYASYSGYINGGGRTLGEPADESSTFEVINGVVNYIGDWYLTRTDVRIAVNLATIAGTRRRYPWLEQYQLFVSVPGRESFALSWGQVQESHGS